MTVYILAGARTPQGSLLGSLSTVPAPQLGAKAILGAMDKIGGKKLASEVSEVFMGNVIGAGVGQAPARQAAIFAELPHSVPCTTVNKVCGSGLQAIILGAQSIMSGKAKMVVAGGMENMSLAPHLMNLRTAHKFGAKEMKDSMQWDGLWDVYSQRTMGACAEECAKELKISREEQDSFAIASFKKAQEAIQNGTFKDEIVSVSVEAGKSVIQVEVDEGPQKANFDKVPTLAPAFAKDGTITAANSSTINDGAAAVILGDKTYADQAQFRIVNFAGTAQHPTWFTTAPVSAMEKCLKEANLKFSDIDLFEINEAFAMVALAAMKKCDLPPQKVNIFGGAIALGHPIGCSGARIMVTLMNAMKRKKARLGMAGICIGGGEGLSMIIERLN